MAVRFRFSFLHVFLEMFFFFKITYFQSSSCRCTTCSSHSRTRNGQRLVERDYLYTVFGCFSVGLMSKNRDFQFLEKSVILLEKFIYLFCFFFKIFWCTGDHYKSKYFHTYKFFPQIFLFKIQSQTPDSAA